MGLNIADAVFMERLDELFDDLFSGDCINKSTPAMSLRGVKRASSRSEEAGVSKRRKADTEDVQWQPRAINDLKMSTIYNRNAPEAPAELFRKDLISAMKLPDSEPLAADEYWVITDPWKQEWERGVQVPVNPDSLPEPAVTEIELPALKNEFKLPKQKYVRLTKDSKFNPNEHYHSSIATHAEAACAYDMDACDAAWLRALNGERARAGIQPLREDQLERVIEELEVRCWDKIQAIIKSEEGLGIEYDENAICDVCRSPDSEEGNEMVFCDSCNICVHQACYGITTIPSGQWLCSPCTGRVRPDCALCPNLGGAMKCTPSGKQWAHVSCVLWIPEVSIGCAEKMEPITKISAIPPSRWSLICVLCRERSGACIQCSVKTCKTAYHVTCAFKFGLEMRAIIEDENADDGVKLRSYCQRHSVNSKKDKSGGSGSDEDESKRKRRKDMTSEEKSQARAIRLHEIEAEFDRHVSIKDISAHLLDVDQDGIQYMYNYWKLKRKAGHNRPLLPPKMDDSDMLIHRQEKADIDKKRMFVQLRQDLERVRNLCYMVNRREKLSRSFFKMREQIFHKQAVILCQERNLPPTVLNAVIEANHGPSIYDRLYSHAGAPDHSDDFDTILSQIAGADSEDDKKDLNGIIRKNKSSDNPYKRMYFNGSTRRSGGSIYSELSSGAESIQERDARLTQNKYRKPIYSSTDDEEAPKVQHQKKKTTAKDDKDSKSSTEKKKTKTSRNKIDSSTEEDAKGKKGWQSPKSRTLRQMEREMGARPTSGTESEDLIDFRPSKKCKISTNIYSDSDVSDNKLEDINEDKSSNATSDSQQHTFRTKAAVKEFIPVQKNVGKSNQGKKYKTSDDEPKDKPSKSGKAKDYPSDLIVPQRQAAKKASENMRSTTSVVKSKDSSDNNVEVKTVPVEEPKPKSKPKYKERRKETKEISPKDQKKESKSSSSIPDIFEFEKDSKKDQDIIPYVPQRQAAKKAAEHIKSGMSKAPEAPVEDPKKKDVVESVVKKSPKKEEEKKPKLSRSSSSSSSFTSSSSSCSSSSSEAEDDDRKSSPPKKPTDFKSISKSLFSPPRQSNDLPFLDKGSKILSSSSSSSDSETHEDSPSKPSTNRSLFSSSASKKPISPSRGAKSSGPVSRKAPDKKSKAPDASAARIQPTTPAGEKSSRTGSAVSRTSTRTRTRSTTSGSGNLFDRKDTGPRKSAKDGAVPSCSSYKDSKENRESSKLPFAQWKADKKLKSTSKQTEAPVQKSEPAPKKSEKTTNNASDKYLSKSFNFDKKDKSSAEPQSNKKSSQSKPDKKLDLTLDESATAVQFIPDVELVKHEDIFDTKKDESDREQVDNIDKNNFKPYNKPAKSKSPKGILEYDNKLPDLSDNLSNRLFDPKEKTKPNDKHSKNAVETEHREDNKLNKFLQPAYPNRSIFSPTASKDAGCGELDDFGNDMLAVDETVDSGSFHITQESEELMKPLTFSFSADFFFKEDSKEDRGVRETLHLVEKLRMKLDSKKSGINQPENSEQDSSENKEPEKPTAIAYDDYDPFKKSDILDDPKDTDKPIEKEVDKNLPILPPTSMYDLSHNSDIMKDVEMCPNRSPLPSNFNMEPEKTHQYNVENEYNQGSLLEKINMLTKEPPFLQNDKCFDNRLEGNATELPSLDLSMANDKPAVEQTGEIDEAIQPYENRLQPPPECTPISSPYSVLQQQTKWNERELIPVRRSSTSSASSDASSVSNKPEEVMEPSAKLTENIPIQPPMMDYPVMPSFHPCPIENLTYNQFSSEASQFVGGPVLFPTVPEPLSQQPPIYAPNTNPYESQSALISLVPKINEPTVPFTPCSAAFTSSSHNMALTTAIVDPLTPKPTTGHSPIHEREPELSPHPFNLQDHPHVAPIEEFSNLQSQIIPEKVPPLSGISPVQGKKSSKPVRASSRFIPQGKSPYKSPTKSPKQSDLPKTAANKRGVAKATRGSGRGRGRPKGKTSQNVHTFPHMDMPFYTMGSTIHKNLAGTVYDLDFDDETANDSIGDLKSMRERRRSTDNHERKGENSFRDASHSPLTSPQPSTSKRSYNADFKDLRPPTPIPELPLAIEPRPLQTTLSVPIESVPPFNDIVQPVLPGPVDMRTYSSFEPSSNEAFNNHLLGAFASGTADQQLQDIDEEVEKELHSALIASSNSLQEPFDPVRPAENTTHVEPQPVEILTPKVSLTDPRNQLKVKIKGPFLDANYSAGCIAPVSQQPVIPTMEQPPICGTPSAVGSVSTAMLSGTSNLRRMRKKELLRQYCTQDMNMDDPGNSNQFAPPAPVSSSFSRNVITIPKAVASMTSIPTREDYKAVVDANMERKRRKVSGGMGRELRHLEDGEAQDNQNSSSNSSTASHLMYKRRGRTPKSSMPATNNTSNMPIAPKLKIKIGNIITSEQSLNSESSSFSCELKPPKKRLTSIPKPSVEDLKRESMKFRRMVMADFDSPKKKQKKEPKDSKESKEEKRKKKREKREEKEKKASSEMHVVDKQTEDSTKLIIRISRKKDDEDGGKEAAGDFAPPPPAPTQDPFVYDPMARDPLALDPPTEASKARSSKVSPIRLKLSRGAGGSGYVMKDSPGGQPTAEAEPAPEAANANQLDPAQQKHCEVR